MCVSGGGGGGGGEGGGRNYCYGPFNPGVDNYYFPWGHMGNRKYCGGLGQKV